MYCKYTYVHIYIFINIIHMYIDTCMYIIWMLGCPFWWLWHAAAAEPLSRPFWMANATGRFLCNLLLFFCSRYLYKYWHIAGAGEVVGCGDEFLETDSCFFLDPNQTVAYMDDNHENYNFNHRKVVSYFTSNRFNFKKRSHGTHVSQSMRVILHMFYFFSMLWDRFLVQR